MTNFQRPMMVGARSAPSRDISEMVSAIGIWSLGFGHSPRLFAKTFANNLAYPTSPAGSEGRPRIVWGKSRAVVPDAMNADFTSKGFRDRCDFQAPRPLPAWV